MKRIIYWVIFLLLSFLCHAFMQRQYYMYCNGNIIQVVFFKNSSFCMALFHIIKTIEQVYFQILNIFLQAIT